MGRYEVEALVLETGSRGALLREDRLRARRSRSNRRQTRKRAESNFGKDQLQKP
jgi:hypothetical protein